MIATANDVEQVRQYREHHGDDEAHYPTGDGRQKGIIRGECHDGLRAQAKAEEEAPDRQQHQEQAIAGEAQHHAKQQRDHATTHHSEK